MRELTYTQEYVLLVLAKSPKLSALKKMENLASLYVSGITELIEEGAITLDTKGKMVTVEYSKYQDYLDPLYQDIAGQRPKTISSYVSNQIFTFTGKKSMAYIDTILDSLIEKGILREVENQGVFNNATHYLPDEKTVDNIVQKIRAEFLEDGELTEETLVLTALLHGSKLLPKYFSEYESKKLKERINEIKKSPAGATLKRVLDEVQTIIVVIAAS